MLRKNQHISWKVWIRKTNVSEPLINVPKREVNIERGSESFSSANVCSQAARRALQINEVHKSTNKLPMVPVVPFGSNSDTISSELNTRTICCNKPIASPAQAHLDRLFGCLNSLKPVFIPCFRKSLL